MAVASSGDYTVEVTGFNGCKNSSDTFHLNASVQSPPTICMVSVDSATGKNLIVWEKPVTTGIDSFVIYKESNVADVYTKMGAQAFSEFSTFLDATSTPEVIASRYKISAVDTCGTETLAGDFHKTIHLTINQGIGTAWNLIWSSYEGTSFGSYKIYRGSSPSNMQLLTTIQSNLNSYTDLNASSGALYYQIEVLNTNGCSPKTNYGSSRSNIINNGILEGIKNRNAINVKIYPNPSTGIVSIELDNYTNTKLFIQNELGQNVYSNLKINSATQVELKTGVYFVRVQNENYSKVEKLIIMK